MARAHLPKARLASKIWLTRSSRLLISILLAPLLTGAPALAANDGSPGEESACEKYLKNGLYATYERRTRQAEQMLLKAIRQSKATASPKDSLIKSRLALASLYLKQERYAEAHDLLNSTLGICEDHFPNGLETAECYYGLARTEMIFNKLDKAQSNAEEALKRLQQLKAVDSQLYGQTQHVNAMIVAKHGWYSDATPLFVKALSTMEHHPGYKSLDLADVLREQALFYHGIGERRQAARLYEESYSLKERVVQPDQSNVGQVRFVWEPGSTRSEEIIDSEFPFRYLSANGVRVAATVVDLWELLGVLITVTNVGDHQAEFDLGSVRMEKVDLRNLNSQAQIIRPVDPKGIDRIRRERTMWDLTHTRPWLANIQKTRAMRGLVPASGHDLFRGPNVFGVYGEWKAVSHIVPERIAAINSRESIEVAFNDKKASELPGLVSSGESQQAGLTPIKLEPFESRTGELFYLNPRDQDIIVKVPIGNALFELPFHTRKKRIP